MHAIAFIERLILEFFSMWYAHTEIRRLGSRKTIAAVATAATAAARRCSRLQRTKLASDTHSLQSRRQSRRSHAEQLGGPARAGHFAAGLLQSPHNALAFLTFPIVAGSHFGAGGDVLLALRLNWSTRFGRTQLKAQLPVVCENDRSLDGILKLANVSRPSVGA